MTDIEESEPTELELQLERAEIESALGITSNEATRTLSIVSADCILREYHSGTPVTYKGITGNLIRYAPGCEHQLMTLTASEAREALQS